MHTDAERARETQFTERVHIKWYPTRELNGIVWRFMGADEHMPEDLPPLDFVGIPEDHRLITKQRIDANWAQVLEGDFDPSHISFLHGSVSAYRDFISRDPDAEGDDAPEPENGVLTSKLEHLYWHREPWPKLTVMSTPYGMFSGARRSAGPTTHYYRFNQFILPFYAGPPGDCEMPAQCNIWVPMDDRTTVVWRISYYVDRPLTDADRDWLLDGHGAHVPRDGYREPDGTPESRWVPKLGRDNEYGLDHDNPYDYFAGIVGIWAQDRACTEGMGPILDRSTERLVSSDAAVALVRRILLHTATALAEAGTAPPTPGHVSAGDRDSQHRVAARRVMGGDRLRRLPCADSAVLRGVGMTAATTDLVTSFTSAEHQVLSQTTHGTALGTALRHYWIPALLSEEIPDTPVSAGSGPAVGGGPDRVP